MNDKTVVRGGYGLFWAPWAVRRRTTRSATRTTTTLQQDTTIPITSIDNPFPTGLIADYRQLARPAVRRQLGHQRSSIPNKTAPHVHQYSVDMQRELGGNLSVGVAYIGSTGRRLTWGPAGNVNINQLDPTVPAALSGVNALTQNVPNPFFGVAGAGSVCDARDAFRGISCCGRSRSSTTSTCRRRTSASRSITPA